jgi:oligopeptide/dipeptide ABC transporter ATP-binding protein
VQVDALHTLVGGSKGFLRRAKPPIRAVNGVSLALERGQSLGIVGESGCGKSTLGRTILGVLRETEGRILLDGNIVSGLPPRRARHVRREIQYVYQDAAASLDPWWRIGRSLRESLVVGGSDKDGESKVDEILRHVGLSPEMKKRYPHELSGGQLRRVALARILILVPRVVIFDEPTAGLDVSVQAAVLRLMRDLQERLELTYMLISHDLSVVRVMCDRTAIMYLGKIVELAPTRRIFEKPAHPYTRLLLQAAPRLDVKRADSQADITGFEPPNPANVPSGCAFRTRCPFAIAICAEKVPVLDETALGHAVACHRWAELPPPADEIIAAT